MKKFIAEKEIDVNEEGYLTDFSQWNKAVGNEIAKEHNIEMTNSHWEVVDWIQEKVNAGTQLSIRGIKRSGVIDVKKFYHLFPGGPLKISTKIAGVPKPKSCI
ncbi:TusE/DsrC/DsvC family sulfur relay protein [Hyunsoonleella rubra]|uniref:TusE/DsrC/DsvC family sulfur relay protein n=1 Tax=Hyunsoonleella rubra TaxID=1737062 RepID=A0ABW5TAB5_9FLAO